MLYFELIFNIFCLNLQIVSGDDSEDSDDESSVGRVPVIMFGNENADPEVDNFVEDESDNEDSDRDIADPGDVEIPADFVPGNDDEVEGGEDENVGDAGVDNEDVAPVEADGADDPVRQGKWLTYSDLMVDSYPSKSKVVYLKAYKDFERYLKSMKKFVPNARPTEEQVLNYFHHLRHDKHFAPTTLWSTYARINACVKRLYGFSLKEHVRVSDVLKSYETGYTVKKASTFTPGQVCVN